MEGWKAYSQCTFFPLLELEMRTYNLLKTLYDVSK